MSTDIEKKRKKKKKEPERKLEEEQKKKKRKLTHLKGSVPPHTGQTLMMKKRINPSVVGDP